MTIIEYLFKTTYFIYDDKYYQQLFDSAIGAPASPVLANIIVDGLITTIIGSLDLKIFFINYYVDDIILAIPSNQINNIVNKFNTFNNNIQFTIEVEKIKL